MNNSNPNPRPPNKLDKLLAPNPVRFLAWLESQEGAQFSEYLVAYLSEQDKTLGTEAKLEEIYRAQGGKRILRELLDLPGIIREYIKGVSKGTMKQIEKPSEVKSSVR